MSKIATRVLLLIGAIALTLGVGVPARAQSASVCVDLSIVVNGMTIIEQPVTCVP